MGSHIFCINSLCYYNVTEIAYGKIEDPTRACCAYFWNFSILWPAEQFSGDRSIWYTCGSDPVTLVIGNCI